MLKMSFNYGVNFGIYLMPEMKTSPLFSFCDELAHQHDDERAVTVLL